MPCLVLLCHHSARSPATKRPQSLHRRNPSRRRAPWCAAVVRRTTPESPGATRASTSRRRARSSVATRSAIISASSVAVSARFKPSRDVTTTVARDAGASSGASGASEGAAEGSLEARASRSRLRMPQNRATATCVSRSPPSPPGDGRRNIVVGGASASTAAASACASEAAEKIASRSEAAAKASSAPTPFPELMPGKKPPTPRSRRPAPRVVRAARPRRPGDAAGVSGSGAGAPLGTSGLHFAFRFRRGTADRLRGPHHSGARE